MWGAAQLGPLIFLAWASLLVWTPAAAPRAAQALPSGLLPDGGPDGGASRSLLQSQAFLDTCPNGERAQQMRCNCAVLGVQEARKIFMSVIHGGLSCTPVCTGEEDTEECDSQAQCPNGNVFTCFDGLCGTTVTSRAYNAMNGTNCTFDAVSQLFDCGGHIAIDRPTFETIESGVCVPFCEPPQLMCQFSARFGAPLALFGSSNAGADTNMTKRKMAPRSCPDNSRPQEFQCGCDTVSAREIESVEQVAGVGHLPCQPMCGSPDTTGCDDSCDDWVCILDGCGTSVSRLAVENIRSSTCRFLTYASLFECGEGDQRVVADEQTVRAVYAGSCAPACNLVQEDLSCVFAARFGPSFFMGNEDLAPGPSTSSQPPQSTPAPALATSSAPANASAPSTAPTPQGSQALVPPAPMAAQPNAPGPGPAAANVTAAVQAPRPAAKGPGAVPVPAPDLAPQPAAILAPEPVGVFAPGPAVNASIPLPAPADNMQVPAPGPAPGAASEDLEPAAGPTPPPTPVRGPGPAPEPATQPAPEPAPGVTPDATPAPAPGPASVVTPQPASEPTPGSAPEVTPEPAPEPTPEPAPGMTPEPALEPTNGSAPGMTPEPAPEPTPKQAPEQASELTPELAPETTPVVGPAPATASTSLAPAPVQAPKAAPKAVVESTIIPTGGFFRDAPELQRGPWRQCSQVCKQARPARKERSVFCRSRAGTPTLLSDCPKKAIRSEKACKALECQGDYHLRLGEWSQCSQSCQVADEVTGELLPGVQQREGVCSSANGTSVDASFCRALQPAESTRTCNAAPCNLFRFSVGPWSTCSCLVRQQNRVVECVDTTGRSVGESGCRQMGLEKPREVQGCEPDDCGEMPGRRRLSQSAAEAEEDACKGNLCSGHGECRKGSCKCNKGFQGPDCQLDVRKQSKCPTGVLDVQGKCCENAAYDHFTGECCPGQGAVLDKDGRCCDGTLDVCGVCNGKAIFIDALGRCCDTTLDSAGLCCQSGDVDVCGVCDGFGASCATQLVAAVQGDTGETDSTEQCVAQGIADMLELEEGAEPEVDIVWTDTARDSLTVAFNISGMPTSKQRALEQLVSRGTKRNASGTVCAVTKLFSFVRLPVCGNGVCEVGEASGSDGSGYEKGYSCPGDCPLSFDYNCPTTTRDSPVGRQSEMCSGNGRCLYAEVGRCDCYAGYEGDACDRCALGLMPFNGKCILRTGGAKKPSAPGFCCAPGQVANNTANDTADGGVVAPGATGAGSTAASSVASVAATDPQNDTSGTDSQFMGVSEAAFTSILGVSIIAFMVCISLALLSYKNRSAKVPRELSISDMHTTGDSGPLSNRVDKTYSAIWHEFRQGLTKTDGGARSLPMIMSTFDPGQRGDSIGVSSAPMKHSQQVCSTARSTPRGISSDWVSDSSDARERTRRRIASRSTASIISSSSASVVAEEFTLHRPADIEEIRSQCSHSSSEKCVSIGDLLQAKQQALGESPSINVYGHKSAFYPNNITEEPVGLMGAGRQHQSISEYGGASVRSGQMNMAHVGNKWRRTERPSVRTSAQSGLARGQMVAETSAQSIEGNNSRRLIDGSKWEIEPASQSSEKGCGHVMVSSPWTSTASRVSEDYTPKQQQATGKLRMPPPAGVPVNAIYNVRTEVPAEGSGLVAVGFQSPVVAKAASRGFETCQGTPSSHGSSEEAGNAEGPLFSGHRGIVGQMGPPSGEAMGVLNAGILRTMQVEEATGSEPEVRGTRHVSSRGDVTFPQFVTIKSHEVAIELSDWEREMSAQNGAPAVKLADVWESASHASLSYGEQEFQCGNNTASHPLQEINPTWSALSSHSPDESRPEGDPMAASHPDPVGGGGLAAADALEYPSHRQLHAATVYANNHLRLSDVSESTSQSSGSWGDGSELDRNFLRLEDVPQVASPKSQSCDEQHLDGRSFGCESHPVLVNPEPRRSAASSSLELLEPESMRVFVRHAGGLAHPRRSLGSLEEPNYGEVFATCPSMLESSGAVITSRTPSPLEVCSLQGRNVHDGRPLQ